MPKNNKISPEKYNLPFIIVASILFLGFVLFFSYSNLLITGYTVADFPSNKNNNFLVMDIKRVNFDNNEILVLIENQFNQNLKFNFNLISNEGNFYYQGNEIISPYNAEWVKFQIPSNLKNFEKLEILPYANNKNLRKFTVLLK